MHTLSDQQRTRERAKRKSEVERTLRKHRAGLKPTPRRYRAPQTTMSFVKISESPEYQHATAAIETILKSGNKSIFHPPAILLSKSQMEGCQNRQRHIQVFGILANAKGTGSNPYSWTFAHRMLHKRRCTPFNTAANNYSAPNPGAHSSPQPQPPTTHHLAVAAQRGYRLC